jgi:hypothetical protein
MSLSGTFVAATNLEGMCGLLQIDCCGEARDCCNAREHVVCGSENAGPDGLHWLTAIRPRSRLRSHSCGPEQGVPGDGAVWATGATEIARELSRPSGSSFNARRIPSGIV